MKRVATVCFAGLAILQGCSGKQPDQRLEYSIAQHVMHSYPVNLVRNGSAEAGVGSPDDQHIVKPDEWETKGNFTVVRYGGANYMPSGVSADHHPLGNNFFAGGPPSENGDIASASQSVTLRGHEKGFMLSAWLGGWYTQRDYAQVQLTFQNAKSAILHVTSCKQGSSPCLLRPAPVYRAERAGQTTLLFVACGGSIPTMAEGATITMLASRLSGGYNDGYFDNVAFRVGQTDTKLLPRCESIPAKENTDQKLNLGNDCSSLDIQSAVALNGQVKRKFCVNGLDTETAKCLIVDSLIFASIFGFMAATLAWLMPIIWRTLRNAPQRPSKPVLTIAFGSGVFILTGVALPFLRIGMFQLADIGCLNQPWFFPSLAVGAMTAYIFLAVSFLVLNRWLSSTGQLARWALVTAYTDIALVGFVAAVLTLAWTNPSFDQLRAIIISGLLCTVAATYALFAFWPSMQWNKTPGVVRVGLLLLLLIPVIQPIEESTSLRTLERQRYASERATSILRIPHTRQSYDNVAFIMPIRLGSSESADVQFYAKKRTSSFTPSACLMPRLVAPGFDVRAVLDEPIPLSTSELSWEWIVTPSRAGPQSVFLSVLYSANCKGVGFASSQASPADQSHSRTRATGAAASIESPPYPFFTAKDAVFVSRPWLSADEFDGSIGLSNRRHRNNHSRVWVIWAPG